MPLVAEDPLHVQHLNAMEAIEQSFQMDWRDVFSEGMKQSKQRKNVIPLQCTGL